MKREYTVAPGHDGIPVRDYLRKVLGYSANAYKSLKFSDGIRVGGEIARAGTILHTGDAVSLDLPETSSDTIVPTDIPLDVLYEDDDLLAVNKPVGMPVHPSIRHFDDTLANAVMYYYRGTPFTYRVLTRLDIDTTGVVLIAKNAVAAGRFSKCTPVKTYLAVAVGTPNPKSGTVDAPIARDEGIMKRKFDESGKPSVTHYMTLAEENGLSLVKCVPVTGRTHQIRVHLSYIGCPLYGDYLYGTEIVGERTRLHCASVTFDHPMTGERMTINAPAPADFTRLFPQIAAVDTI